MNNEGPTNPPHSRERHAFAALVALLLAPVLAHGLWRPLVHVFGPAGDAATITLTTLTMSATIVGARTLTPGQTTPALALAALLAVGATVGLGLGLAGLLTLLIVALTVTLLLPRLISRLPSALDGLGKRHKLLTALYVLLAAPALISTARLSIFMGDPNQVDDQVLPGVDFLATHSCLTAYVHADALTRQGVHNVYDTQWWHGSEGMPPLPAGVEKPYQPFFLDYYAYPPAFLLGMAPLAPFEHDFPAQRALWFGLNGLLLAAGLWIVARWIGGPNAHRVLLLAPLFFGSMPVLATLQVGNFQIAVVMLAILAMVAFDRHRHATGGALLAFAILSKLSPGIFGIVLLAQRRWRSAAWTAGFGAALIALSLLTLGMDPTMSFLTYTLPRLSSGETFAFLDDRPFSILTNMAPFGLPFKLQLMGLDIADPWVVGRRLGQAYTLTLIILAVLAVRGRGDRRAQALTWMSLLVLAALQSPFAPGYTSLGLLWAITLLSVDVHRFRHGAGLVLLWLFLTVPLLGVDLPLLAAHSILQSTAILAASIWLIVRAARSPATA